MLSSPSSAFTLREVDPRTLVANPWNVNVVSPDNEAKIEASIDRHGLFKPIIARTLPDGRLEILGGQHRTEAAIRKGIGSVPVIDLGEISVERAKEISLIDNGRYGVDDAFKLSELLSDLGSHDELSSFLPFSQTELESIFTSTSIALEDIELPEDDEEPIPMPSASKVQSHQVMRFKVPVEDAADVMEAIEEVMKAQGFTEQDSLSNAGDALVWIVNNLLKSTE